MKLLKPTEARDTPAEITGNNLLIELGNVQDPTGYDF